MSYLPSLSLTLTLRERVKHCTSWVGLDSEKRLFLRKDAKRGKIMGKEAVVSVNVVYIIQT